MHLLMASSYFLFSFSNAYSFTVKCYAYPGQIEEVRKILLRSISVLVGRNPFCHTFSSIPVDYFHHSVAKTIPGDVFAIERAEIVHNICWYSLKCYRSKFLRYFCRLVCFIYLGLLVTYFLFRKKNL